MNTIWSDCIKLEKTFIVVTQTKKNEKINEDERKNEKASGELDGQRVLEKAAEKP